MGWVLIGDVGWGVENSPKTPKKPKKVPENAKKPPKMAKKPENTAFFDPFLGVFGPYVCFDTFLGEFRASPALGWETVW